MGNTKLRAPVCKFRVIAVDTFESPTADYLIKDCDSLDEAIIVAKEHAGQMNPTYVYDDAGILLFPSR